MLDGIALTTEAVLESVAMVMWEGMSSTAKSELELVAMGMERGVAMITVSGCYDNMSGLLWGYVLVAMGVGLGCYGNKVWQSTNTLWLCQYVVT